MKRKQAFTTAEMLVTIMIFSLGILPLIVLFQNSYKQTAQAKNLMIAQSIGRTYISEIRSMGFDILAEEIKSSKYGLMHTNREVTGKLVTTDDESIEYPEYYKRFKTSLRLEDSGTRSINGITKPANKIRVELDIEWQEPNRTFKLGFGTVVAKYDS